MTELPLQDKIFYFLRHGEFSLNTGGLTDRGAEVSGLVARLIYADAQTAKIATIATSRAPRAILTAAIVAHKFDIQPIELMSKLGYMAGTTEVVEPLDFEAEPWIKFLSSIIGPAILVTHRTTMETAQFMALPLISNVNITDTIAADRGNTCFKIDAAGIHLIYPIKS